jgi:hypothetical protein
MGDFSGLRQGKSYDRERSEVKAFLGVVRNDAITISVDCRPFRLRPRRG